MNEKVVDERKVEQLTQLIKKALIGVVCLSLVAIIYYFVSQHQEAKEQAAFSALFEAERFERDLADSSNPFDPKFYEQMATWSEEQRAQYTGALAKVVAEHGKTRAAQWARLRLARMSWAKKDFVQAEKLLQEAKAVRSDDALHAQVLHALAVVYEDQSKSAEALAEYELILALKEVPLKPVAHLGKARLLRALQKSEEAKSEYEKVTKDFPNTVYEKQARALMSVGE